MYEFNYHKVSSVADAAALLARNPEAKLLAGGQTLIAAMKLRLAAPPDLVDLAGIKELTRDQSRRRHAHHRRHDTPRRGRRRQGSPAVHPRAGKPGCEHRRPHGAQHGHHRRLCRQQRSGGRLPGGLLGLGATINTSKRKIAADDFFKGMYETALEPGRDHHVDRLPGAQARRLMPSSRIPPRATPSWAFS